MKQDAPFYVGSTNVFDYQARTGMKRWNTLVASAHPVRQEPRPTEADILHVQCTLGLDYMQARNHVKGRMLLKQMQQM